MITVLELKNLIAETQRIDKVLLTVVFKGKLLDDNEDLTKLGVHNETILVIHLEPPYVDLDVTTEPSPLTGVIRNILYYTDPPDNLTIEGFVYTERAFHDMCVWLTHMKSSMDVLRDITGNIIPNNLEKMNLECLQFRPNCNTHRYYTSHNENSQVTYFLLELNLICHFFWPFLQYYNDIISLLEMISTNDEKYVILVKIKELVIELTHNLSHAYHVLYSAKIKIDARQNSTSSTNHPGPSKATDDPIILDSMLFNYTYSYLKQGLTPLAKPVDVIHVLDSTFDDDLDENES